MSPGPAEALGSAGSGEHPPGRNMQRRRVRVDGIPWCLLGPPLAENRDSHQEKPTLRAGPSPSVSHLRALDQVWEPRTAKGATGQPECPLSLQGSV